MEDDYEADTEIDERYVERDELSDTSPPPSMEEEVPDQECDDDHDDWDPNHRHAIGWIKLRVDRGRYLPRAIALLAPNLRSRNGSVRITRQDALALAVYYHSTESARHAMIRRKPKWALRCGFSVPHEHGACDQTDDIAQMDRIESPSGRTIRWYKRDDEKRPSVVFVASAGEKQ